MAGSPPAAWPAAEGECAALVRTRDWSATPLGPTDRWPQSLRTCLDLMLPASAQIVLFWGPQFLAFYNDAYAPTIGLKHPQAMGRPASEGWAELWDDLGPLLQSVRDTGRTVAAADRPFQIDRQGFMEEVFFDISYSPVRGESGEVAGVMCIVKETTGQVLATRALAANREQLRRESERIELALNAGAVIGTWVWDIRNDHFTGDERFARTFSVDPAALRAGLPIAQVKQSIHPDDTPGVNEKLAAAMARGGAYSAEYRVRQADGGWLWIEANGRVELDASGAAARFPGVLIDISRRRRVEEAREADLQALRQAQAALAHLNTTLEQRVEERTGELKEAEARLRQSQKMEALGQLTGGIAHDFNNLLQGITGSIEVLRLRLKAGRTDDADRYLQSAVQSAHRAAALVHRLLAFARRQSLDAHGVDTNAMVLSMEDLLRRTLGENIGLLVDAAPGAWPALCDGNQLESAILNLTINARDAMPSGGLLTVSTANATLDAEEAARMEGLEPGDYATISVADTGMGMPPAVLAKAFDPFFTTKPIGQGTGLGLSMIYGFARQSRGHVLLASGEGQGTVATLYLPRHVENGAGQAGATANAMPQGDGETVLVVEDDPGVREVVVEVLRELGYEVLEAVNGATALPHLQGTARIDLLVSDVGLPGMNGRQLAELARQHRPGLQVLLMTGYTAAAAQRAEFLGSGMEMMSKPFSVEDLARKVQEMLGAA